MHVTNNSQTRKPSSCVKNFQRPGIHGVLLKCCGGWAAMVSPVYDHVDCYQSVEDLWACYDTFEPIKAALPAFVWVNHFLWPSLVLCGHLVGY